MPALNRRSFLKSASVLAGFSFSPSILDSVRAAVEIDPAPGSTFLDAEHIVFLMQENRSFDHCFGALQGVRGFNDPRAIDLPNGRPVWLQADAQGRVYAPFHLDIHGTSSTFTGYLPHSWGDQQQARNGGRYDQWLVSKRSKELGDIPLTLGYHTRADIPFYYALADAFTVCDQHFCSSLTGTTPNRLYFWTGTIRAEQSPHAPANISNNDTDHGHEQSWTTIPERLSAHGISWRIYQNELTLETGLTSREKGLLGNFGDNPLEYFSQYRVRFHPAYYQYIQNQVRALPAKIEQVTAKLNTASANSPESQTLAKELAKLQTRLKTAQQDLETWHPDKFAALSPEERSLHQQAFTSNSADPDYRQLASVPYTAGGKQKSLSVPKGDIFHQFRADADAGRLPTVSWLVAPQTYSDHPSSPWNGAWYVSEALKILTRNPELWKKTIFILNYDENDGYFDHIPPFVAPFPGSPETGACSEGVDASCEFGPGKSGQSGPNPIGLGFRVPMIVASPWSRGGWVNSQVFDLTSPTRFLEYFLQHKFGKPFRETNVSSWRRAICGDMTSLFRPWNGEAVTLPEFLLRDDVMISIAEAEEKPLPDAGQPLTSQEIAAIKTQHGAAPRLPKQEPGTRPSCALPYELRADCLLSPDRGSLLLRLEAGSRLFGENSAGAPFQVYAVGKFALPDKGPAGETLWEEGHTWHYAVAAGKSLSATLPLADFPEGRYQLRVYGPNGFYREFKGAGTQPELSVLCEPDRSGRRLLLSLNNLNPLSANQINITHHSYGYTNQTCRLAPAGQSESTRQVALELATSSGWYDFTISAREADGFGWRYAGRIEDGLPSLSDPAMGAAGLT